MKGDVWKARRDGQNFEVIGGDVDYVLLKNSTTGRKHKVSVRNIFAGYAFQAKGKSGSKARRDYDESIYHAQVRDRHKGRETSGDRVRKAGAKRMAKDEYRRQHPGEKIPLISRPDKVVDKKVSKAFGGVVTKTHVRVSGKEPWYRVDMEKKSFRSEKEFKRYLKSRGLTAIRNKSVHWPYYSDPDEGSVPAHTDESYWILRGKEKVGQVSRDDLDASVSDVYGGVIPTDKYLEQSR